MRTILTQDDRVAQEIRGQEQMKRLESADPARMREALTFLIGFDGDMFETIMDAVEPVPSDAEPEPGFSACDQALGLFMGWGTEWQRYRGNGPFQLNRIEVQSADHAPILLWQLPESPGTDR